MDDEKIDVHGRSLKDILNTSGYLYQIPDYQRPYSWNKENISDLIEDLYSTYKTSRDGDYFCGSIVIVENKEGKRYDVIDGQQRLTTFTIFLCVLRDFYSNNFDKKTCDALQESIHDRYDESVRRLRFRTDDKSENDYEQTVINKIEFKPDIKENQVESVYKDNKYLQNAWYLKYYLEHSEEKPENLDMNAFINFIFDKVLFTVIRSSDWRR